MDLACKNIRFSSLFVAGYVSGGGTKKKRNETKRNVPSREERGETDVFAGYNGLITCDSCVRQMLRYGFTSEIN